MYIKKPFKDITELKILFCSWFWKTMIINEESKIYGRFTIKKVPKDIIKNKNKLLIFIFLEVKYKKKKGYTKIIFVFVASDRPKKNDEIINFSLKRKYKLINNKAIGITSSCPCI